MSEEKDLKDNDQKKNMKETEEAEPVAEKEDKKETSAEDRYKELNEKYIRNHAEFDNYRKRSNKEKIDLISTAGEGIIKDLLPIIDDFERAIDNNVKVEDIELVREGFVLIFNKFKGVLESKGLKPMDSPGDAFDVDIHEAISNIPAPKKKLKGKVIEAVEKGYYLNNKVIRFAKVVVGQ
jgi:molecular chaperone GrpE